MQNRSAGNTSKFKLKGRNWIIEWKDQNFTCNTYNKYHCNTNGSPIIPAIFGALQTEVIITRD
jgi:hypothetical protein